ncbi:MAG: ArsR/SmtB family transcription factor [Nannocystaceae bacterium]
MSELHPSVDLLNLFADAARIRLLRLLDDVEISVGELVQITGMSQSRVSTQLAKLRKAALVRPRRAGASVLYRSSPDNFPALARPIWDAIRAEPESTEERNDRARRRAVLAERTTMNSWADGVAGQMENHYSPGRTWEATAHGLLGLMSLGDVLDIGSGDGVIARLLAPRANHITCLDRSEVVIKAARERLSSHQNISFDVGDMHMLPYKAQAFDQVLILHVLTYADDPGVVLREAARVLRSGGTLIASTLAPHEHREVSSTYGHQNAGFSPTELEEASRAAGLTVDQCRVSSRERQAPFFEVVTLFAQK